MPSELAVFLLGTLVAGFAAGLAGFAFGLVAASFWLHVMPPTLVAPLIVAGGLSVQLLSLWRLRRELRPDLLWPFLLGGVLGVPLGAALLPHVDAGAFRFSVGLFLVAYSLFMLARPHLVVLHGGRLADGAVGAAGGLCGGLAGLNGVLPTIWCGLRGWPKETQRGVYQPYILATHLLGLVSMSAVGTVTGTVVRHYLMALPLLAAGALLGLALYARIDAQVFRRVLLVLLLVSGAVLLV